MYLREKGEKEKRRIETGIQIHKLSKRVRVREREREKEQRGNLGGL